MPDEPRSNLLATGEAPITIRSRDHRQTILPEFPANLRLASVNQMLNLVIVESLSPLIREARHTVQRGSKVTPVNLPNLPLELGNVAMHFRPLTDNAHYVIS